jgi:glutaminyl-tRNA synthetase
VRLRYAYFLKCINAVKDKKGNIIELHCTYDSSTKGGDAPDGRKVKATLHWVSAKHSISAEVRLYDYLFTNENPLSTEEGKDFKEGINPDSLKVIKNCRLEPSLSTAKPGDIYQFERKGYFCVDSDTTNSKTIFNRTVTLKDKWARIIRST